MHGVRSKHTSKFNVQDLITLTMMHVHQIFLRVNMPKFKPEKEFKFQSMTSLFEKKANFFRNGGSGGIRLNY